jgi:hypothetical protein
LAITWAVDLVAVVISAAFIFVLIFFCSYILFNLLLFVFPNVCCSETYDLIEVDQCFFNEGVVEIICHVYVIQV